MLAVLPADTLRDRRRVAGGDGSATTVDVGEERTEDPVRHLSSTFLVLNEYLGECIYLLAVPLLSAWFFDS